MTNTTGARGSIELAGLDDTVGPLVRRAGEIAMREFRASPAVEDKGGERAVSIR